MELRDGVYLWSAGKWLKDFQLAFVASRLPWSAVLDFGRELRSRRWIGSDGRVDLIDAGNLEERAVYAVGRDAVRRKAWQTRATLRKHYSRGTNAIRSAGF